jgi:hypothetical protein
MPVRLQDARDKVGVPPCALGERLALCSGMVAMAARSERRGRSGASADWRRARGWVTSIIAACTTAGCGGAVDSSSPKGFDAGVIDGGTLLDGTALVGLPDAEDGPQGSQGVSSDGAAVPDGECSPTESILTCEPAASLAACWTCGKQMCSSQLTQCAQDAACNAAIVGVLNCVDEGGDPQRCFLFASTSTDVTVADAVLPCLDTSYGLCGCMTSQGSAPPDDLDADLPLCSCTTVPPYGNAMCMQTASCRIPSCPVAGSPCCTPAGLCGCASAVPGGPDLTCN